MGFFKYALIKVLTKRQRQTRQLQFTVEIYNELNYGQQWPQITKTDLPQD